MMKKIAAFVLTGTLVLSELTLGVRVQASEPIKQIKQNDIIKEDSSEADPLDDYQLEKMVVLSRHNMRAPNKISTSLMEQLTPNAWTDYTASEGELTLLGGMQETAMGQYFRKYLADKGLIDEDYMPKEGEIRFYANSIQRTIATSEYFKTGMLPVSNIDVEYHEAIGSADPVFNSCIHYISDAYKKQVQDEIDSMADGKGLQGYIDSYSDSISLLEDVLDFEDSEYAKKNKVSSIPVDDTVITLELGQRPKVEGGIRAVYSAADALSMQYYAEHDLKKASFGKSLTFDQWKSIDSLYTLYLMIQYGEPSVAINVTHPLLQEIKGEMTNDERIFSFLCGHDSNMIPLLIALDVEEFDIDNNLSDVIPIGSKLVWEKYLGDDGKEYARFAMVYQSSQKLRENELVTLNDPPTWIELNLNGLKKNKDGLYLWDDVVSRFDEAIAAFYALPKDSEARWEK